MLKALECRYDADDKLPLGPASQAAPACALADSEEFDVASSSTSCADSGRGLSCEVHDEPTRIASGTESCSRRLDTSGKHPGRVADPGHGRCLETFGQGGRKAEPTTNLGLNSAKCLSGPVVTLEDCRLMAHSAALDASQQIQLHSAVDRTGSK